MIDIDILRQALAEPLPAADAHRLLTPAPLDHYYQVPDHDHRTAAVLFLLYPKGQRWHTCFIQRSTRDPRDKHAGQIGLPGGGVEPQDMDLAHTARRETHEEVGVSDQDIDILGPLTSFYIFASGYMVHPYVGAIDYEPTFVKQDAEVDDILEIAVDDLLSQSILSRDVLVRGQKIPQVACYDISGRTLWGATAMMVAEFLEVWRRAEAQAG